MQAQGRWKLRALGRTRCSQMEERGMRTAALCRGRNEVLDQNIRHSFQIGKIVNFAQCVIESQNHKIS